MDARTHVPAGARRAAWEGVEPLGVVLPQMIHPDASSVKQQSQLAQQAHAAELRALANAAWHRERAGRYLAWCDSPWAAAQYERHAREAAFQEALAARHRQIAAAMGQVRP